MGICSGYYSALSFTAWVWSDCKRSKGRHCEQGWFTSCLNPLLAFWLTMSHGETCYLNRRGLEHRALLTCRITFTNTSRAIQSHPSSFTSYLPQILEWKFKDAVMPTPPGVCWGLLVRAGISQLCASLHNSTFSDLILVASNQLISTMEISKHDKSRAVFYSSQRAGS